MFKSYIPKEKISVIMAFDQVIIRSKNDSFNDGVVVTRRCANFQPSAWGDYFISCQSNTMVYLFYSYMFGKNLYVWVYVLFSFMTIWCNFVAFYRPRFCLFLFLTLFSKNKRYIYFYFSNSLGCVWITF